MALRVQKWISLLLFITVISRSNSGKAEEMALQTVKGVYDMSVGKVFEETSTKEFGNAMVNRFIVKLNGKIKDALSGKELNEDLIKKLLGILQMFCENCRALMKAVTPKSAEIPLRVIIDSVENLKKAINMAEMTMKNQKQKGQTSSGGEQGAYQNQQSAGGGGHRGGVNSWG